MISISRNRLYCTFLIAAFRLIFSSQNLYAQVQQDELGFRNYTVEDGLPSNETYQVFQDSRGYIWIATDRGVSRYNGYEFENFTTANGLPDNTVFAFYEDYKHRIWFHTFNGKLGYYSNNQFNTFPHHLKFKHIISISVDSSDILSVEFFHISKKDKNSFTYKITGTDTTPDLQLLEHEPDNRIFYYQNIAKNKITAGGKYIYITGKVVVVNDNNMNILKQINTNYVLSSIVKRTDKIYITTEDGYLFTYDVEKEILLKNSTFKGKKLSYYFTDNNKGEWISTLNNGILYRPRTGINYPQLPDSLLSKAYTHFKKMPNYSVLVDKYNTINILKGNKIIGTQTGASLIKQIVENNDNCYITDNNNVFKIDRNGKAATIIKNKDAGINSFHITEDTIWVVNSNCELIKQILQTDGKHKLVYSKNIPDEKRPRILAKNKNLIWIGGMEGLNCYDEILNRYLELPSNPLLNSRIEDIKIMPYGALALATRGAGLLIVYNDNVIQITEKDGLINNILNNIELTDSTTIWVSSHTGASKISISNFSPFTYSIINFSKEDGILSKQINSISSTGDSLYFATSAGICVMHKNLIAAETAPEIIITKIEINKKSSPPLSEYILPYDENNINIYFTGIYYPDAKSLKYEYKLINKSTGDTMTQYTNTRMVSLLAVSPGKYSFELRAISPKGIKSKIATVVSITINSHPLLRWWVFLIEIAVVALLIYWYMSTRVRRLKKELLLRKELKSLENKALSAQMNPHFIFNALTAVQHFILKEDKYKAYSYLSSFATLIRTILKNSEEETVALSEEIELLKNYLELEKLRFEHKFDYEIEIAEGIDKERIHLPAMLIQPYAENAVRHGFMHKNGHGNLKINFSMEQNILVCRIEDDGIGRVKSAEYRENKEHKSFGMNINERRLEILNEVNKEDLSLKIEDLYNAAGEASGTKVTLYIPVKI